MIGGGLPVGAYGGRREIMEMVAPVGPMYQAGTLSGNPLAMTAGLGDATRHQSAGRLGRTRADAARSLMTGLSEAAAAAE